MTSPTRVLFLEVDAGDKVLIQRWAADGTLPTFRELLARGAVGDTLAPPGLFVGGIWPSLYTGVSPARHGVHSLVQLVPGTYEFRRFATGELVKREPFWDVLSRAGQRVAILDVPLSGLSEQINGIQSVEWGSHDSSYGFRASPPSFAADLIRRFGRHPLTRACNEYGRAPDDFIEFRDLLIEGVEKKAELTCHYLRQGGWDFFAQVFTESHCVGHQCWHLHDPAYPGHDPEVAAITGDPIRDVYGAIDRAIGRIIAEVGDDTVVIVLAGHRMAHKIGAQFLLPDILVRLGVAVPPDPVEPVEDAVDHVDSMLAAVWARIPESLRARLLPLRDSLRGWIDGRHQGLPPSVSSLDPAASDCFLTDNGFPVSGLRLNLKGREPQGRLGRGPEADAFVDELRQDLLALVDGDTGQPLVERVRLTSDLYEGEYLEHLPDLLVEWSDAQPLGSAGCGNPRGSQLRVRSDKIGVVEGVNDYCRTGDHRPEGLFMAVGPGIPSGRLERVVPITAFAPTFASLLGAELPDVDSGPIRELTGD